MEKKTLGVYLKIENSKKGSEKLQIIENSIKIKNSFENKIYSFTKIFKKNNQEKIYEKILSNYIKKINIGLDCCIFNYGVPYSEKTSIFFGDEKKRGLADILLENIFNMISISKKKNKFVTIKVFEVYKEKVRDLLDFEKKVSIRENNNKMIMNLIEVEIEKIDEFVNLINLAFEKKTVKKIKKQFFDLSHFFVEIEFKQKEKNSLPSLISKFTFIDLAMVVHGVFTKKESSSISKSLLSLKKCINLMGSSKKNNFIPFRDSILTKLMKNFLVKNHDTICIGCIDENENNEENLKVLEFLSKIKKIKPKKKEDFFKRNLTPHQMKNLITDLE